MTVTYIPVAKLLSDYPQLEMVALFLNQQHAHVGVVGQIEDNHGTVLWETPTKSGGMLHKVDAGFIFLEQQDSGVRVKYLEVTGTIITTLTLNGVDIALDIDTESLIERLEEIYSTGEDSNYRTEGESGPIEKIAFRLLSEFFPTIKHIPDELASIT